MSDNDVHDLALSDNNMETTAVDAVTGVVETTVVETPVTGIADASSESEEDLEADLASDHLEGSTGAEEESGDEEEDETEETEAPAVVAPAGLRFRSFQADRAGSDTEEEGGVAPWPPMPSSPLRLQRQVGTSMSPLQSGVDAPELTEAIDRIRLVEAGPVEVAPGDVPVPVWLFLAAIAALMVYLTAVAYILSWQCGVRTAL